MRTLTFAIFMISFTIMGYWLGNTSIMSLVLNTNTSFANATLSATGTNIATVINPLSIISPAEWSNHPNMVFDNIFFWILILATGIGLTAGFANVINPGIGQGISFASFYIFPAIIIFAVIAFFNFVIFPFSFILDPALPNFIGWPLVLIYNTCLVMFIYYAIRGGG